MSRNVSNSSTVMSRQVTLAEKQGESHKMRMACMLRGYTLQLTGARTHRGVVMSWL